MQQPRAGLRKGKVLGERTGWGRFQSRAERSGLLL